MNEVMKTKKGREDSAAPQVLEIEKALIGGDLSGLPPEQRVLVYKKVCDSLGLNHLTSPFAYIRGKDGKLKLYALKDCTEQLRKIHRVSITSLDVVNTNGVYTVRATGADGNGRIDSSLGAVSCANLKGEDLANAMMKAETKAKRRLTLSICGLGMLDESELDGMRGSRVVSVEEAHTQTQITGELVGEPEKESPPPQKPAERYFRFKILADEQRDYLQAVGEYREDIRAWVFPGNLPENFYKKIEANEISADLVDAELLQRAAAAASGAGDIPMDPPPSEEPRETNLQKAQKRASAMKQTEHVSGALAKLESLKQSIGGR